MSLVTRRSDINVGKKKKEKIERKDDNNYGLKEKKGKMAGLTSQGRSIVNHIPTFFNKSHINLTTLPIYIVGSHQPT